MAIRYDPVSGEVVHLLMAKKSQLEVSAFLKIRKTIFGLAAEDVSLSSIPLETKLIMCFNLKSKTRDGFICYWMIAES